MWTLTLFNQDWIAFQWGVVIVASLIALCYDVDSRRIPNHLTGPLALTGLLWAGSIGGWAGLADGLTACVLMATPCVLLFVFAGGGAGDAKMMGALGLWLGLANGLAALAAVMLAGAIWGVAVALARKRLQRVLTLAVRVAMRPAMALTCRGATAAVAEPVELESDSWTMPYAVAIFTGICLTAGGMLLWRM